MLNNKYTLLYYAILNENIDIVKLLLEYGANPNIYCENCITQEIIMKPVIYYAIDYDNYDISFSSLNEKNKKVPYVIKYIYEDIISLLKIQIYKHNEEYTLSLTNLLNSYNEFIMNTNCFNHDNTNKFIIGLKQYEFNNYKLQSVLIT
jgi:ankyrin repeat protein